MDSNPDTTIYSDAAFYDPTIVDPTASLDPNAPTDSLPVTQESIGDVVGSAVGLISSLPQLLNELVNDVIDVVQDAEGGHPTEWLKTLSDFLGHYTAMVGDAAKFVTTWTIGDAALGGGQEYYTAKAAWDFFSRFVAGFIYRGMLESGLGVDTSKFSDDAQKGVNTIDAFLTFSFFVQFASAVANGLGKGLLGARWSETVGETLRELPQAMGLTWAEGLTLEDSLKTAIGESINEDINQQKRGNRIGWPQVRLLLKQQAFNGLTIDSQGQIASTGGDTSLGEQETVFVNLLQKQGFPDYQIQLLKNLKDVQVPVGDIAQLWYRGVIDDDTARKRIAQLGFDETETDWLFNLYLDKSENEASVTYRTVARYEYLNHLITEDMYRGILDHAHYPSKLIDEDILAIKLEQDTGRILQQVGAIKTEYQRGDHSAESARHKLRLLNYNDTFITELLHTWDLSSHPRPHGLSQAKVLSYWYAHVVVDRSSALSMLMATGLTQEAADFLLDHPPAANVRVHARTPSLVTQAYVDGAIPDSGLSAAYTAVGVSADALPEYLAVARYRMAHRKGSPTPTYVPDIAFWEKAQKAGIIGFNDAVQKYEQLGMSADVALIQAEIVNKGPFQAASTPIIANLNQAINYMISHGYTVLPPPDPALGEAEGLLAASGYSWSGGTPPQPIGSPGGVGTITPP